ncbi:hypothetical protein NIES46_45310 [Arthrospira platensis NIES-46]|uniref:Uncharacterized protein n=1 Tax=Limnospira platensis NIES-46 TaxID=1236695 RepID=A0A5M3TFV1_LIMPL|nr:hypothetical protein NIES46_45310 [Arthrospira platensis NIES-46]
MIENSMPVPYSLIVTIYVQKQLKQLKEEKRK